VRLEDYLDGTRGDPGLPLGVRGFGATPGRAPALGPLVLAPLTDATVAPILDIFRASEKARVDEAMWTLDSSWLSDSRWMSMKSCSQTSHDAYGGDHTAVTPWTTQAACRTPTGAAIPPHCMWGYWQVNKCSLDVASKMIFQYPRYLWAQQRMREHLALQPQQGVASADEAAEWVWKGAQLLSAYFWSTNVRFNNMEGTTGGTTGPLAYAKWAPPSVPFMSGFARDSAPPEGGFVDWSQTFRLGGADADFAYDGPPTNFARLYRPFALYPRVLNLLQQPPSVDAVVDPFGPTARLAAPNQSGFGPGNGLLPWLRDPGTLDVSGRDVSGPLPALMGPAQVAEVRAIIGTFPVTDASVYRWAATKAYLIWWFRATWSWDTMWQYAGDFTDPRVLAGPGQRSIVVGGAVQAVAYMSQWLANFSDPSKTLIDWMQYAFNQWDLDTAGVGNQTSQARSFVAMKQQVGAAVQAAADHQAAAARMNPTGTADQQMAVSLIQAAMALITTIVTAIFPLAGILLNAAQQLMRFLVEVLFATVGPALGYVPCSAMPFIRIMSPPSGPCDLTLTTITSSILGIDSSASWPVAIAGQTRTFQVDGRSFTAAFGDDTTPDLVARRINGAAAQAGFTFLPATVVNGQVHVEGRDGASQARATGGTAAALGFPGALDSGAVQCGDGSVVASQAQCPPPPLRPRLIAAPTVPSRSGAGGFAIGAGVLLALRLLLG
jgi:hypothetical protein